MDEKRRFTDYTVLQPEESKYLILSIAEEVCETQMRVSGSNNRQLFFLIRRRIRRSEGNISLARECADDGDEHDGILRAVC